MMKKSKNRARKPRRSTRTLAVESLDPRRVLAVVFGDFDGDGNDDMATGIVGENVGSIADAGAVSVIYGTDGGLNGSGSQHWHQNSTAVEGFAEDGDAFGAALAVGDFDNDGYEDLAVGAPGEDIGDIVQAGAVNILYGTPDGLKSAGDQIFHQDTTGIEGVAEAYDRFGAVLTTGDFNGDQYIDLAIGVPNENVGNQQDAGIIQILYGSHEGLTLAGNQMMYQGNLGLLGAAERYDQFGAALAAGDFNKDGKDDLAVGAPGEDVGDLYDVGVLNVIYGTHIGLTTWGNQLYTQDSPNVADEAEAWDNFGAALATGDFNNDGRYDLAIGAPNEDIGFIKDAGAIHVMYGKSGIGFLAWPAFYHQDYNGIEGVAERNDNYGAALTAGDFNGDLRDDLAIGVPGENVNGKDLAGAVNLMYSGSWGVGPDYDRMYHQDSYKVQDFSEEGDLFGATLAVGDTDGDGYADLAVGTPGESVGGHDNAGAVHVFEGRSGYSLRTDNDLLWHQNKWFISDYSQTDDSFGGQTPQSMATYALPQLQSHPGATKHLFLDFNGGLSDDKYTPSFDMDGQARFVATERAMIEDVWAYVAEDFAPFDINVTTVQPASGEIFRVLIGGDGTERQKDPTSGWAPIIGAYTNSDAGDNDVFVYSERIHLYNEFKPGSNLPARIGATASHEAGHGFGLGHKGTYHAFGALLDTYSEGGDDWTPIMGANLSTDRTIWMQSFVPITFETNAQGDADFEVLENELGLRSEDHASFNPTHLGSIGASGMLTDTGVINHIYDWDVFSFEVTMSNSFDISLHVADVGANLDSTLELKNQNCAVVGFVAPSDNLNATISVVLSPGVYALKVGSEGYFTGDVGQFTLRVEAASTITYSANFLNSGETEGGAEGSSSQRSTASGRSGAVSGSSPALSPAGANARREAGQPAPEENGLLAPTYWGGVDEVIREWPHTPMKAAGRLFYYNALVGGVEDSDEEDEPIFV